MSHQWFSSLKVKREVEIMGSGAYCWRFRASDLPILCCSVLVWKMETVCQLHRVTMKIVHTKGMEVVARGECGLHAMEVLATIMPTKTSTTG